jgi:hypothetical protein
MKNVGNWEIGGISERLPPLQQARPTRQDGQANLVLLSEKRWSSPPSAFVRRGPTALAPAGWRVPRSVPHERRSETRNGISAQTSLQCLPSLFTGRG